LVNHVTDWCKLVNHVTVRSRLINNITVWVSQVCVCNIP